MLHDGGAFVYLGVHPCFASPFVDRSDPEAPVLRPGYLTEGWQRVPPGPDATGVRARVGVNHLPLASLLNAIVDSGFAIERVEEPGGADPPIFLALRTIAV